MHKAKYRPSKTNPPLTEHLTQKYNKSTITDCQHFSVKTLKFLHTYDDKNVETVVITILVFLLKKQTSFKKSFKGNNSL